MRRRKILWQIKSKNKCLKTGAEWELPKEEDSSPVQGSQVFQEISVHQKLRHRLVAVEDKYYLLTTFPGYGYKGDVVSLLKTNGETVIVKNGDKKFCINKDNLSICQAPQQQVVPKSQY